MFFPTALLSSSGLGYVPWFGVGISTFSSSKCGRSVLCCGRRECNAS
jgi:hypothetical protein